MKKFFGPILLAAFILPAAANAAGMLEHDLTVGSRGEEVKEVQTFLAKDRALYPEGIISGYFGVLTRAAVGRFQEREGIAPALGYFGPKTRARINAFISSAKENGSQPPAMTQLQSLLLQVKELERQIALLREAEAKPAPVATSTATTTPVAEPESQPSPPAVSNSIMISGGQTQRFAESVKLGDVTIFNDSTTTVVLYQLTVKMEEAMNAPNSRGATFKLILRNGTTTYDNLLSSRDVTIHSQVPSPGTYHAQFVYPYAGVSLSPGESKIMSLWAELLIGPFYGGEMKFTLTGASSNLELPVTGTATLILREP